MAEHCGNAICGQLASRPTALGADCQAAIRLCQKSVNDQLALPSQFAGVRGFAQQLAGAALIQEIRHRPIE
eukprot:9200347-Pyramimonas_sp.AAC.1